MGTAFSLGFMIAFFLLFLILTKTSLIVSEMKTHFVMMSIIHTLATMLWLGKEAFMGVSSTLGIFMSKQFIFITISRSLFVFALQDIIVLGGGVGGGVFILI